MNALLERIAAGANRQMWFPGLPGLLINPFYFARKGLAGAMTSCAHHITGTTLDIGCGSKPYRRLYPADEYIGMEILNDRPNPRSAADLLYDGKRIPIASNSINSVVLNEVLEHVFTPTELLSEVNRILDKDGKLLISVPFVWDEHEQPYDYARYSSFGIKYLIESHGFNVLEQHKTAADISVVFQLLNGYVYKIACRHSKGLALLATLLIIAPINLIGAIAARLLPANPDLFLDNVIIATKSHADEKR